MEKEKHHVTFHIERLSSSYLEQLVNFRKAIYDENKPTNLYTLKKEPPSLESMAPYAKTGWDNGAALVAIRDNRIIGEVFAKISNQKGDEAEIVYAVEKEFRGTGVIYSLLYQLTLELERRGIKEITAVAFNTNIASKRLMEKLGAEKDNAFNKGPYFDERRNTSHESSAYKIDISKFKNNIKEKLK